MTETPPVWETVLTGAALENADVQLDALNRPLVVFSLTPEGADIFGEYTGSHIGQFLTIVLDKQVISSPQIDGRIDESGSITGQFTQEEARTLALQLRYGRLPIPLRVESIRTIGATLGQLSIEASIQAGVIGVSIVLLFMVVYYRLPGSLAALALIVYALINFAIFKGLGVTLTLPAITGFLLSTGMAVDANILVFERMKEELRAGKDLPAAIDAGFSRAWSSIRDSNIATLVICVILWAFGRNFSAGSVQGFAITLSIGVMISMFTAVIVTRTLVRLVMGRQAALFQGRRWILGV
jgi:protein-export membrane protein SecD